MAGGFEALDDFLDDAIELPVKGRDGSTRTFRVESPPGEDGLRIQTIVTLATRMIRGGEAVDTTLLDDQQEIDLFRLALGDVYDDMLTFARWDRVRHAAMTAVFWVVSGRSTAERYWASGGASGEAPAPNRAARRKKSSGSASARSTPRRGSTSGTSGRKGTASARKGGRT